MAQVARRAGVSAQTVSRVLSGHQYVADATRDRVLEVAESLGYRMNRAARTLVTGKSWTLGVVVRSSVNYSSSAVTLGIENAARLGGYATSIATCDPDVPDGLAIAMARLDQQSVDGIIVAAPLPSSVDELEAIARRVPTVTVDGRLLEAAVVTVNQVRIGQIATEHLLSLGHPNVHHVAGPEDWIDAAGRIEGWESTLRASGLHPPVPLKGDWSPESGYQAGRILADDASVTAVFVANDEMALGVIRALVESGRRVPDDVSVVGVDNIDVSAYVSPALTTVAQPFEEIGGAAVAQLRELVEGDGSTRPAERVLSSTLILRDSTAAYSPQVSRE